MARNRATPCVHRWVLGEPRDGAILGVCRRCGARRTYPSGLELPETLPDYEELTASHPPLSAAAISPEMHALRRQLVLDESGASLS